MTPEQAEVFERHAQQLADLHHRLKLRWMLRHWTAPDRQGRQRLPGYTVSEVLYRARQVQVDRAIQRHRRVMAGIRRRREARETACATP